ncbi:TPA: hypothetical protein ACXNLE_002976 [Klebsiella aerogenes]
MTNNQLTDQKLTKIVESAEAVISALAGNNDDVHPDDSTKMCRLWDALNDDDATPEVVLVMAKELQERRKADREPVGYFGRFDPDDEDLIDQCSKNVKGAFPLYRHAQPAPVVPEEMTPQQASRSYGGEVRGYRDGWNACRAAMLQAEPVTTTNKLGNSPVIPDGYVMVPMRLTAENGAKWELSGEFSETRFVNCPECFGDDECETCDGSGRIGITVPVTWTTIKEIWAKGVEHFAAAPQEVKGE